jgi:hypothetical protein
LAVIIKIKEHMKTILVFIFLIFVSISNAIASIMDTASIGIKQAVKSDQLTAENSS